MDDRCIPRRVDQTIAVAQSLVELLEPEGIARDRILLGPAVQLIAADESSAKLFCDSLEAIKRNIPGVQTVAAISNLSFGLRMRRLLNRAFLVLALER